MQEQEYLQGGTTADGEPFAPICYIRWIEEPDFGCEGRPDGQSPCGTVCVLAEDGEKRLPIREDVLFRTRLDDRMWVAEQDGTVLLVSRRGVRIELNETERTWLNENGLFGSGTCE